MTRRLARLRSQPRRRRREGGEGFQAAARTTLRRAHDLAPVAAAVMYLADTLDWLNLWHHDGGALDDQPDPAPNHLFPAP